MVNLWLPEPPNENPLYEIQNTNENVVIMATNTSDDEEEHNYDGYEPLPLTSEECAMDESSEEDTIEETNVPIVSLPTITPIEHTLEQEVWNAPPTVDIEMDASKANEVKLAMANFTLPSSSIPDWAVNIPEDQWKQQLIDRIQLLQSSEEK